MITLQTALEKIGLSDKETKVYLVTLELGAQPASSIAKRSGLNRSTAYVVLNCLINKGLMSCFEKNGILRYQAVNPQRLVNYIDNKKSFFEECKQDIIDLLPRFETLLNAMHTRPKVKYFEGTEGVKAVMEDTLTSSEPLRCYSSLHRWLDGELKSYIRDYGKRRIFQHEIPLKSLVHDTDVARKYLSDEYPKVHNDYRFIPDTIGLVDNEVNIYEDKVAIVSLKPNDYFGVIIESPQIAETQKAIFELAWLGANKKLSK